MQDKTLRTVDTAEHDRIGFFGKLPSHGDFVSWGFSRDFELTIQKFLQTGLQSCQSSFGSDWEPTFAKMPPWRFIVERGLWCPATVAGVLMTSRDRVGRRFPLVVALQMHGFTGHPHQLYLDESWFTAIEAMAETAGLRDFDLERFTASLRRLRRPRPGDLPEGTSLTRKASDSMWWSVEAGSRIVRGFRDTGAPRGEDLLKLMRLGMQGDKDGQTAGDRAFQASPYVREPIGAHGAAADAVAGEARRSTLRNASLSSAVQDYAPARETSRASAASIYASSPVSIAQANRPSAAIDKIQPMQCSHAYASHAGTRTTLNADALLAADVPGLFAVADGIGDTPGAARAAKLAVNLLGEGATAGPLDVRLQETKGRLGRANSLLYSHRRLDGSAAVASVSIVALLVDDARAQLVWAGDARCYLLRQGMMRCLTRDHIAVGLHYRLARAIGLSETMTPEWTTESLEPGDRFLLCSAPLVRLLGERSIAECMIAEELSVTPSVLIENGLVAGARENLTALCVAVDHA